MKSLTALSRHLRYPLIGILIGACGLFYVRKVAGPPFPLSPAQATVLCTATAGCKSLSFAHRYDPALHRLVVAVRLVVDRKARKDDPSTRLLQTLDARQADQASSTGWGWAGRRLELRYE